MGSVRSHGSSSLGQAQVTFGSNVLPWSPFVDGTLESRESLVFPAAFPWGPEVTLTSGSRRGTWSRATGGHWRPAPRGACVPASPGPGVLRRSSAGGGALREEGNAWAQSLLVPGSSFWQQHEEGGLQEAAEAAECGHKPMGVEARVAADHTLEDVGLQGERDS